MNDTFQDTKKQKEILTNRTKLYEAALTDELKDLKEEAKKVSTTLLVAGGVALVTYLVAKRLFSKKDKPGKIKKKVFYTDPETQMVVHQPRQESTIAKMIKEHIALFLIGIIKEKIAAYVREAELKYITKANGPHK